MDDHSQPPGSSSDQIFQGVQIKNDSFSISIDQDLIRLIPDSGKLPSVECTKETLFDAVPEINSEGVPSCALAIQTTRGIRRMIITFPEWAGGTGARDRFHKQVHTIIHGASASPQTTRSSKNGSGENQELISGIKIKGASFTMGISASAIALIPEDGDDTQREFPISAISDVIFETDTKDLPCLTLAIRTSSGTRRMILSFPHGLSGESSRDGVARRIQEIAGISFHQKQTPVSQVRENNKVSSFSGIRIKGSHFTADLKRDQIALIPETGGGGPGEFHADKIFDITPEFTPEGEHAAVLSIRTPTGIRRVILCFSPKSGGSVERDRFITHVRGIIDHPHAKQSDSAPQPRRGLFRNEYPICQRSGLFSGEKECGLLLTSKRLIVYERDGQNACIRDEFRTSQILDASPTIDLSGRPAAAISIIQPNENSIQEHIFVFHDETERDSWIDYITADELPPPMIEGGDDEIIIGNEYHNDTEELPEEEVEKGEEEEDQEKDQEIPGFPDEQQTSPVNRCPICMTVLSSESPWCDICGVMVSPETNWRDLDGYSLKFPADISFKPWKNPEYGRFLTFLIYPSGASRFKDDPLRIPLLTFLASILVCILVNIGFLIFFSHHRGFDPSLYPALTKLTTDPVVIATFTAATLFAAVLAFLIAAILAYVIIGREEGSFRRVIRITLYAALPFGIVGLIPGFGLLVAGLWSTFILSGALRSTFDFSVPASFLPPVTSYGMAFCAIILLPGGIIV
ncbi:MAG: YIP1 family protein [Methanocalculus sp. MSAO_Arc2]|nr:MAG: YIP1 family protein [Methanocalculus sp. MSAO_Arc2]